MILLGLHEYFKDLYIEIDELCRFEKSGADHSFI